MSATTLEGRESSSFEWHERGFAQVCEILDERAA